MTPRSFSWTITIGVLLCILSLGLAFLLAGLNSHRIPIGQTLPVFSHVADFSLTNENGAAVSLTDLRGRVWMADIIFTRCPGPCLRMTQQMRELQAALPSGSRAKLVTLTTDPDFDTPPVLAKYALRFGANTNRWMFLTGTKKQIGDLASGSLKLSAVEVPAKDRTSADDLFIHSTIFVLVDKRALLRAVIDTGGDGVDWTAEKQKLLAAERRLEQEP